MLRDLNKARAKELHTLLGGAYSFLDCRKALMINNQEIKRSLEWLIAGGWIGCKLITWDTESLSAKVLELLEEFPNFEEKHIKVLMNCAGDLGLTRMALRGDDVYLTLVSIQEAANRATAKAQLEMED